MLRSELAVPVALSIALAGHAQAPKVRRPAGSMVAPAQVRNAGSQDEVILARAAVQGRITDLEPPGALPKGSGAAAARQDQLLDRAARALAGGTRLPDDRNITQMVLSPTIDPETGLVKEDAENLDAGLHNRPEPNKPEGRRARIAEVAGVSPDEAVQLYPIPDKTKPYQFRDIHTLDPSRPVTSQEEVVQRLLPGQGRDREDLVRNAVLTDAEASFAVNAALGLPFPIRVGRVDMAGVTSDGVVLFSPDLLRADPLFDQWRDLTVTYRFMHNEDEVYKDTIHVRPFVVVPRPNSPVTHLWVSCDRDVMVYALRGVSRVPRTNEEARAQVQNDVVPVNSWLRASVKLYGIRWGLLPTVDELTRNPATRDRLAQVLSETGLLRRRTGDKDDPLLAEFRQMADRVKASGIMPNRPK